MTQTAIWMFGGEAIQIMEPDGESIHVSTVWRDDPGWADAVALAGPLEWPAPLAPAPVTIEVLRARASLPRAEFLLACVGAELMTPEDALLAAKGEVPAAFAGIIAGWPEAQQFEAGLRWAALTQVDRLHPLIVAMAAAIGVSDAQLDAIFGISGDET